MVIMKALGQSVLKLQTDLRGLCHLLKIHVEREDLLWLVIINTKDIGVRSKPTQNLLAGYRANLNTQTSTGANVEKNHQALITLAQLFINTFLAKIQFQLILMLMSIVIWKLKKKKIPFINAYRQNQGCFFTAQEKPGVRSLEVI